MSGVVRRLEELFEREAVEYETVFHPRDYTARKAAADTHSRPEAFAKTVFLWVDERLVMAVLPADHSAAPSRIREALDARSVRLASEEELARHFPDCEVGAAPPFGHLWGIPVYVSPALARRGEITFNAGSHDHAVRMGYADWARLAAPKAMPLSHDD